MGCGPRIFINTRSQTAGLRGVQRYTAEIQRRLDKRVQAVAPRKPTQGVKGHLWEQVVLPKIVRDGFLWSPANTGPLMVKAQVLTVHDVASLEHPEWYSSLFASWYRWMTPKLVRRVRRVITVSEFSKQRLIELTGVHQSRIVVIPEGVDGRFHPRSIEEVERVKRDLRIPSPRYVLSLGALEPRKNLGRLLTAWSACSPRFAEDIWLVIAGPQGADHVFSHLDLGSIPSRVHITGFVADNDLPALYSGALALAYVSIYEGFGLPALEAMASGTVPIAANNTALPELIGDAGLLVDPFDTEAIAMAIERLVEDLPLRENLKTRALKRSKVFNWECAANLTLSVLLEEAMAS
jgi:glycosyltransferase involved in cell wall biosynthesis